MIIGKSLTALGGGGLNPEICVTAKAGALLNLHYKDSSIILQSYQLEENETQYTFVVSVSETAYVVDDATNGASVEVLVDAVAQYSVEIEYVLWLYKDGNECEDITGGWTGYAYASSNDLSKSEGYTAASISVIKNSNNIVCSQDTYGNSGSLFANNLIPLTDYNKLCISYTDAPYPHINLRVTSSKNNSYATVSEIDIDASSNYCELDISAIQNSKYICVNIRRPNYASGTTTITISKIWLE